MDRESGRCKGYGFVTFSANAEASSAIQALNGKVNHQHDTAMSWFGDISGSVVDYTYFFFFVIRISMVVALDATLQLKGLAAVAAMAAVAVMVVGTKTDEFANRS